ncbi:MAG: hypothetical protein WDN49_03060 [Acetobacteraceae bacterium]
MLDVQPIAPARVPVSALVLADRLLSLAQDADRAGFSDSAQRIVGLVYAVLDERPPAQH